MTNQLDGNSKHEFPNPESITEKEYVFKYEGVLNNPLSLVFDKRNNIQINAYKRFFEKSNLKTIVVETYYIDRHHDDDLSNYYAKSFRYYSRYCKRLHFFSAEFDEADFETLLAKKEEEAKESSIVKGYIGFLVQRGIHSSEIARTCFRPYDKYMVKNGEKKRVRYFPCLRNYNVNLLGLTIKVESLAYQEQDGAVALCASSAIWSAIHKTSRLFHHTVVSPSKITQQSVTYSKEVRKFPNSGLTVNQMGAGLSYFDLEPLIVTPNTIKDAKSIVGAYIGMGVPIIMALRFLENNTYHAVTISGYNVIDGQKEVFIENEIRLTSNRISNFYCHDDQIRPFSQMKILPYLSKDKDKKDDGGKLIPTVRTSWSFKEEDKDEGNGNELAEITGLIIPLNDIIRITFDNVYYQIKRFNSIINHDDKRSYVFEWSISLWNVNAFKKDIKKHSNLSDQTKTLVCKKFMPKYVWRAIAITNDDERAFELVFDATDKKEAAFYLNFIAYQEKVFLDVSLTFLAVYKTFKKLQTLSLEKLFDQLLKIYTEHEQARD